MSAHLFEVNIRVYVVAEDEDDARYIAMNVSDPDSVDIEVDETESIDSAWADAFPFGGDGEKTCKEYLK